MPDVSVLIAVLNREHTIMEAVRSIQQQTFTDYELLIMDDGSTDGTWTLLTTCAAADPRIRLFRHATNQGSAYAANALLAQATGRYIARLDSDDISVAERLAVQVAYMDAHPDVVLLGGWTHMFQEKMEHKTEVWKTDRGTAWSAWTMCFINNFAHSTVMFRREDALAVGGYPLLPNSLDYGLWLRLVGRGQMDNLPQVLAYYRLHSGSIRQRNYLHNETQSIRTRGDYLQTLLPTALTVREVLELRDFWISDFPNPTRMQPLSEQLQRLRVAVRQAVEPYIEPDFDARVVSQVRYLYYQWARTCLRRGDAGGFVRAWRIARQWDI